MLLVPDHATTPPPRLRGAAAAWRFRRRQGIKVSAEPTATPKEISDTCTATSVSATGHDSVGVQGGHSGTSGSGGQTSASAGAAGATHSRTGSGEPVSPDSRTSRRPSMSNTAQAGAAPPTPGMRHGQGRSGKPDSKEKKATGTHSGAVSYTSHTQTKGQTVQRTSRPKSFWRIRFCRETRTSQRGWFCRSAELATPQTLPKTEFTGSGREGQTKHRAVVHRRPRFGDQTLRNGVGT